jgi:putative transposase
MARLARLAIDRQLHLLLHQGVPGEPVLGQAQDRLDYLATLQVLARELGVAVHAYVLLPERVQLLLTPPEGRLLPMLMQRLGRRFSGGFNARHGRRGSPWAGRYRVTVLQAEPYLLDAMRLLEAAPVRAGLVATASDWPASSAAHHGGLRHDPLVSEHPGFWVLGNTPFEREARYRELLALPLPPATVSLLEEASAGGWALGDADFLATLSKGQARRLQRKPRGRPRRASATDSL